jgi:hypothetical protein
MSPQHAVWQDGALVFDRPPQWPNGKEVWIIEEAPDHQNVGPEVPDSNSHNPKQIKIAAFNATREHEPREYELAAARHDRVRSMVVPIQSFAPAPFETAFDIQVVIEAANDEFTASFFDANIHAVGETETDALDALKDLLLSRYVYLDKTPTEKLALPLQKQQAVLRQFIRRKS